VDAAAVDALPVGHALLVVPKGPGAGSRFLLDQDVVNAYQGQWFQGHIPTSTSVEVKSLATDPNLRLEIASIAVAPPLAD
jgi:hypothetical protein